MLVTRPVDHANLLIQFLIMRANDHGSTFNCPHRLNFSVQRELYELKISPNSIPYHFKSLDINKVTMGLLTSLLRECAKEIAPIYPLILRNGTLTQLPQVVHQFDKALKMIQQVDGIYLDFPRPSIECPTKNFCLSSSALELRILCCN